MGWGQEKALDALKQKKKKGFLSFDEIKTCLVGFVYIYISFLSYITLTVKSELWVFAPVLAYGKAKGAREAKGRHWGSCAHPGVEEATAAGAGEEAQQNHLCITFKAFICCHFKTSRKLPNKLRTREKQLIDCLGFCLQQIMFSSSCLDSLLDAHLFFFPVASPQYQPAFVCVL